MLKIYHSKNYESERNYIYQVIFQEFLGIEYQCTIEERHDVCIMKDSDDSRKVIICDDFFKIPKNQWLTKDSLPTQPLVIWKVKQAEIQELLVDKNIPVIFGKIIEEGEFLKINLRETKLGIDIFGSAFFMLARYEEIVKEDKDTHDRFPATASLAFQEGFLERPIINEYIEILWWAMKRMWPELKRKQRQFRVIPTHDVDSPFAFFFSPPHKIARTLAGDILKRQSLTTFFRRAGNVYKVKAGNALTDENYTFDLIMDISERHNLKSCFYMMVGRGLPKFDCNYSINHPNIINLMKYIAKRGHELGLHPSYVSYDSEEEIKIEVEKLNEALSDSGILQVQIGGRQHYLRWQCPVTWQHYEDVGLIYDSTLSYADHIGFRCGICYEYTVFNVQTKKTLKLKERPLIIMECSAIDKRYMNFEHSEALIRMKKLKEICKFYCGDFIILWHNNSLIRKKDIELYQEIMKH